MPPDPFGELQRAARHVCHITTGHRAKRVVVYDDEDSVAVELKIPPAHAETVAECRDLPTAREAGVRLGWEVSERRASFCGTSVSVARERLTLLRALVEADGPLTARDLVGIAFDNSTDEANVRYHIGQLRRELKAAFPDCEGELVVSTGEGYRLTMRH